MLESDSCTGTARMKAFATFMNNTIELLGKLGATTRLELVDPHHLTPE